MRVSRVPQCLYFVHDDRVTVIIAIPFFFFSPLGECGKPLYYVSSDTPVTIISLKYPYRYPNNVDCYWDVVSSEGESFLIEFISFDTQAETDILTIGVDSHELHRFSSFMSAKMFLVLQEPTMWIRFTSDTILTYRGFELQIQRVFEPGELKKISLYLECCQTHFEF